MSTVIVTEESNAPVVIVGPVTSVGAFVDLTDTPVSLGTPGDIPQVNAGGTGMDFVSPLWVPSYDFEQVIDGVVPSDTYTEILRLGKVSANPGTYRITLAMLFNLDNVNTSAYFRFSLNNGVNWVEVRRESKDITDVIPQALPRSIVHTGGDINIVIEGRKESAGDILLLPFMEITLERKK